MFCFVMIYHIIFQTYVFTVAPVDDWLQRHNSSFAESEILVPMQNSVSLSDKLKSLIASRFKVETTDYAIGGNKKRIMHQSERQSKK